MSLWIKSTAVLTMTLLARNGAAWNFDWDQDPLAEFSRLRADAPIPASVSPPVLSMALDQGDESFSNPLPSNHVYQSVWKLGWAASMYCGPAAVTESLSFLKWFRKPGFPRLKWFGNNPVLPSPERDDYLYSQTLEFVKLLKTDPWIQPGMDRFVTDPANIVKGLRGYFKDSGYSNPWVYARGLRAFDAPDGKTLEEMQKPVTLAEIRDYSRKGFGIILLAGYYSLWGGHKHRHGGHYLPVFGYRYKGEWRENRTNFFVTDSLLPPKKQPRHILLTPIKKNPKWTYPNHVTHMIDGDDEVYLDTAIIFIPAN